MSIPTRRLRGLASRARRAGYAAAAAWTAAVAATLGGVALVALSPDLVTGAYLTLVTVVVHLLLSRPARRLTDRWHRRRADLEPLLALADAAGVVHRADRRVRLVAYAAAEPATAPVRPARPRDCDCPDEGSCPDCRTVALETADLDARARAFLRRPT